MYKILCRWQKSSHQPEVRGLSTAPAGSMSPFTRTSCSAFAVLCLPLYPSPLIRIPWSSFAPPLCQDYLYTFLPWWDPSAYCSTFFLYLALPSLLFPIFPPHTVLILFCFGFFSPVFFPMLFLPSHLLLFA